MASNDSSDLTSEQAAALLQFRSNVSDLLTQSHDDEFLLRWLRARKFDLEKSEKMLREHMKFRKNVGWDSIMTSYEVPEVVKKYCMFAHIGYDVNGCAVVLFRLGKMDYKGLVYSLDLIEHHRAFIYIVESAFRAMQEENKRTGRNARKVITIVDFDGLKVQQFLDRRVARRNLDIALFFEAHFPEILKRFHVINTPNFFYFWYNVVKPLLDQELKRKIIIYDCHTWREPLLKDVGPDALPACYGGNMTDPDGNPECLTMFPPPEKVPESYYVINNDSPVTKDPEMTKIVIKELSYFNLNMQVKLPEQVLRWRFQTLHHDIRFAVYFVPEGVEPMPQVSKRFGLQGRKNLKEGHEMLIPLERIESHVFPQEGELLCEKTGTYLLHFDNTFSLMTSKELYYKVEAVPASEGSVNA